MAFHNKAWMTVASTGTGSITLGTAVQGFNTFAAAKVADQEVVSYTIFDGANWEVGHGVYTANTTQLRRTTIDETSAGGTSPISISASATVFLDVLASDLATFASLTTTSAQRFAGALVAPTVSAGVGSYPVQITTDAGTYANMAMGAGAGASFGSATGTNNIGIGIQSLQALTSGGSNVGLGLRAVQNVTTGNNNVGLGGGALISMTTGSSNVAAGTNAGGNVTTANGNTLFGDGAGASLTGSDGGNTIFGRYVGVAGQNNIVWLGDGGGTARFFWNGTVNTITGNAAFTGNVSLPGVLSFIGSSDFPGSLPNSGNAKTYSSQGNGLVLYGRGDTYDVFIGNRNGAYAMVVSPGSTSVLFGQNIMVPGTGSVGGNSTLRTFNAVGTGSGIGSATLGLQNNSATADDSHGTAIYSTNTGNSYRNYLSLYGSTVRFCPTDVEAARFDRSGNLLVGATSSAYGAHAIIKSGSEGTAVLNIGGPPNNTNDGCTFYSVGIGNASSAATALRLASNTSTGRSINAGGTINASGADYAEYMTKADGCATIAKGDVCGVNAEGHLVTQFDLALSFVVKTTDPNLVGGDTWDAHLPERPQEPAPLRSEPGGATDWPKPTLRTQPDPTARPAMPALPDEPTEEDLASDASARVAQAEWDADAAAWLVEQKKYDEAVADREAHDAACRADRAAWMVEQAAHDAAVAAYTAAMPPWQAAHDAARVTVDRISFCGQVPANLTGGYAVGDYVIAARAADGTIQAISVAASTITFDQYRSRIGKIWAVRDGRAWVDVQHG